eukprot:373242_1
MGNGQTQKQHTQESKTTKQETDNKNIVKKSNKSTDEKDNKDIDEKNNKNTDEKDNLDVAYIVAIDIGCHNFGACCFESGSTPKIVKKWSKHRESKELWKDLTAVLIDKKTNKTVAVGYEAEELYAKSVEKMESDKVMFFKNFISITSDYGDNEIVSVSGTSTQPLSILIIKLLDYIKTCVIDSINKQEENDKTRNLTPEKIYWMICTSRYIYCKTIYKEIIKYCANKIGMKHLIVVDQTVCTSLYGLQECDVTQNKVIVLDVGETVDASCIDIRVSSIVHNDYIFCSASRIDDQFIDLLQQVLPQQVLVKMNEKPKVWIKQRQHFLSSKFTLPIDFDESQDPGWNVLFCDFLSKYLLKKYKERWTDTEKVYETLKKNIESFCLPSNYTDDVKHETTNHDVLKLTLLKSGIKINKAGWLWIHEAVFSQIITFLKTFCDHPDVLNCNNIILSGGFANSLYLQTRLRNEFPDKTFHCPSKPHLSVLSGASIYWTKQSETNTNNEDDDSADSLQRKITSIAKERLFAYPQLASICIDETGCSSCFCPPMMPNYNRVVIDWSGKYCSGKDKNSSALLFDKDMKTLAMGYEAEQLYSKAQKKKEDENYIYFPPFDPFSYNLQKNPLITA